MNVLLIEDENKIASFIEQVLESELMHVTTCDSIEEAVSHGYPERHDVIILDLMLRGKPGDYLVSSLRKSRNNIPILVLSALGQISKKIELLNLGADDYLTKPFDAEELIARVHALYRRYLETKHDKEMTLGDLIFYRKQNRAVRAGREIFLTQKEGDVLDLLIRHRGKAVRTEDILMKVWQAKQGYHSNIVQATIRRLRKKIDDGFKHKLIRNIHGVGYMIVWSKTEKES